jgi:Uma2 family endonuclease
MTTATQDYQITWEKLPEDYILPNEPVDNINQPALATALTESLELAKKIHSDALIAANYGICATLNGKTVVKAPDWAYIPKINVNIQEVDRSYTPHLQGEIPAIVMEFLSDTNNEEYSSKPTYPPGKWFFYERILKVPNYIIFDIASGEIETYRLDTKQEKYILQTPNKTQQYWIPEINLYLGIWSGTRLNNNRKWLRWWDEQGNLLLWASELVEQERQRAERLIAQLRAAGIEPEN